VIPLTPGGVEDQSFNSNGLVCASALRPIKDRHPAATVVFIKRMNEKCIINVKLIGVSD